MSQVKVLLNETLYRTKKQYESDNKVTRYETWGYFENTMRNGIKILGPLIKIEDQSEEIYTSTLDPEQIHEIKEKGFWQCLHDGKKCSEVKGK